MYSLTLEINQVCNMRCSYCYLGEKSGSVMELKTAVVAINRAFEKTRVHKDKKLWIDFIGGEPLLSFDLIKQLIMYIENKNRQYHYTLVFSTTTNATKLNCKIMDFLIQKKFNLKISIDGPKAINDTNRIMLNGKSCYDTIIKKIPLLKKYELLTQKYVQITNVVTKDNYKNYRLVLEYLTEKLNFKVIDSSIDLSQSWDINDLKQFENVMQNALEYFFSKLQEEKGFYWGYVDKLLNIRKKKLRFYTCGGGIISSYVRTDGSIYACPGNLAPEVSIGNVIDGDNYELLNKLKSMKEINNNICKKCELYESCTANCCVMQNLHKTGDINMPDPVLCYMQKMFYRLYLKNQEILSMIKMGGENTWKH